MPAKLPKIKCFKCGARLKSALKAIKVAHTRKRGFGQVRVYKGLCESCGAEVEYGVDFRTNPPPVKKNLDSESKGRTTEREKKAQAN